MRTLVKRWVSRLIIRAKKRPNIYICQFSGFLDAVGWERESRRLVVEDKFNMKRLKKGGREMENSFL